MKTFTTAAAMSEFLKGAREAGQKIAFVPTMGALHEGHLALMREARRHGDLVIVSVFVNPKQFNDPKDYERYARDPKGDLKKCEGAGVDAVFSPSVEDMYPDNPSAPKIDLPRVALPLEGAFRPGHFEGVIAAVSRLFDIVNPDAAVFGLKDYQQVRVIEEMAAAQKRAVKIVRHPTVRERDGLAMSSRNIRLSWDGRQKAFFLSMSLKAAEYLFRKGERNSQVLKTKIQKAFERENIKTDYVAIVDAVTLEDVSVIDRPCLMAIAAFVEEVRLIDNCLLDPTSLNTEE